MLSKFLLFLCFFLANGAVFSNTDDCFKRYFDLGDTYFKNDQFAEAKFQFEAALKCDNINTQEKLLGKKLLDSVINIYTIALERQRSIADSMRAIAEQEKSKFQVLAVEAKANELSLLSSYQYEIANYPKALFLSWQSLMLTQNKSTTQMRINFAKAACSNLKYLPSHHFKEDIVELVPIWEDQFLIRLSNNKIYLFQPALGEREEQMVVISTSPQLFYNKERTTFAWNEMNGIGYWNTQKKSPVKLNSHQEQLCHISFSESQNKILSCSRSGIASFWDIQTGRNKALNCDGSPVYYGEISKDEKSILTISSDGILRIWNNNGQLVRKILPPEEIHISKAIFSPEGTYIIASTIKGNLLFIDSSGKILETVQAHQGNIQELLSVDDEQFISYGIDGQAKLWNIEGKYFQTIYQTEGLISDVKSDLKRHFFCFVSENGQALIWNRQTVKKINLKNSSNIIAVDIAADGQYILITTDIEQALLWDNAGNLLTSFSLKGNTNVPAIFSGDGKTILCLGNNQIVTYPTPSAALDLLNTQNIYSKKYVKQQQIAYKIDELLNTIEE